MAEAEIGLLSFFPLFFFPPSVVTPRFPPLLHFPFVPRTGKPKQTATSTAVPLVPRHPRTEGRRENLDGFKQ